MIIDLSEDVGGTYIPYNDFLINLVKEKKDSGAKVYVVIGRDTFSSGVIEAYALKKLNCILIGEDTGGALDHFGDIRTIKLPNSKLLISYSTKYFNLSNKNLKTLSPDIYYKLDYSWYFKNRSIENYKNIIQYINDKKH